MIVRREQLVSYASVAGPRQIHTETYGEAASGRPPYLFVHSGPGFGAATLRPGIEALAGDLGQVTLFDLPGCGGSSRHAGSGYPMEAYIDDLVQVCRALNLVQPVVVGHGWGAILAVESALAHPGALGSLVLVNPLRILNATGQDNEAQARQVARTDPDLVPRFAAQVWPVVQQAMQGLAPWETVDRQPWWPEMWATMWAGRTSPEWQAAMRGVALGMEAYFAHKGQALFDADSAWARYDLAASVAALPANLAVSVIASEHDANYVARPSIHVAPLQAVRPALPLTLVDGAGHFLSAEAGPQLLHHCLSQLRR